MVIVDQLIYCRLNPNCVNIIKNYGKNVTNAKNKVLPKTIMLHCCNQVYTYAGSAQPILCPQHPHHCNQLQKKSTADCKTISIAIYDNEYNNNVFVIFVYWCTICLMFGAKI